MTATKTLDQLDAMIQERSILQHPFYQAWEKGELSREQLRTYAETYYPHVAAFPQHLETAAELATDVVVAGELRENLADELSNPKPHNELWLDFAEGLGADRSNVEDAKPRPAAQNMVDRFDGLCKKGSAAALAAFYAYEAQQPEVSRQKSDGLQQYYDISDPAVLAYFDVHAEVDIQHRAGERNALLRCLQSGADPDSVLGAASEILDAYWHLLDGICQETGIALN